MYEKGEGVPQDYKEAVKWFRLSAEQENTDAQIFLGLVYSKGQGVPQDYVLAALTLYLDIINLFLYILDIISRSR